MEERKNSPPQNRHFWRVLRQRSARPWKYPYRKPKKAATHRQQPLCNTPRRSRSQAHFPFGRHTSVLYRTEHVSAAHNILWTKFSARIRHKAIITVIFSTAARQQIDITALCNIKIMSVFANITFFVFLQVVFCTQGK